MATYKKPSKLKKAWKRMKKNIPAMFGLTIILVFAVLALFADVIADYETRAIAQNAMNKLQKPSAQHWFGTDGLGRDMFARIVHGSRISLSVGFAIVGISCAIGTLLGGIVTYFGGWVDTLIMRILDVFMSIPGMLMLLSLVAVLGPGIDKLVVAMVIVTIPNYVRLARASMLTIVGNEYIEAAKVSGCSDLKIIVRHLFPNSMGPILVTATMNLASIIIAISGFSFLGIGISSPTPEWGAMLSEARSQMRYLPHLVLIPALAIMLVSLGFNLVGDGVRDALDPRIKG
jgi:peptide/nickel transport system permease protein